MSNTKHTVGPWKLSFVGPICIGVQNGGSYGQIICNSILPDTDEKYEEVKESILADMKLIAAAPDMFSIIRKLADWNELPESIQEDIQSVIVKIQSTN